MGFRRGDAGGAPSAVVKLGVEIFRAQQAQDSAPDPARHLVGAALVQPGIDEQHRDDAQQRLAVAGDGFRPSNMGHLLCRQGGG